ncbi:MAG: 16S rRNA (guanine(966)-N(2))-methyltransferase RsmD [Simkaniaceae bacterium]|nr:16S rRNA (guanine(966)-N(2))-methyltransferase RsmD [Candidatus Sacchlamyda saccharinae]
MKIQSGIYKNHPLKAPKSNKTRPTSSKIRGSVFDILQNQIEGAHFLDVFAGSGSMGLEALSRGASDATFIEQAKIAAQCIRENLKSLKVQARLFQQDAKIALKRLAKENAHFDIIYLDPPYDLDITPVLELIPPLLSPDGIAILEQSSKANIDFQELKKTEERKFGDTTLHLYLK